MEGVDRNLFLLGFYLCLHRSPSSRRAWIEIFRVTEPLPLKMVALLAEGVDRNLKVSFP